VRADVPGIALDLERFLQRGPVGGMRARDGQGIGGRQQGEDGSGQIHGFLRWLKMVQLLPVQFRRFVLVERCKQILRAGACG
jgi:hypothetical protein